MSSTLQFDEIFTVNQMNADGKKFMMTDRLTCSTEGGKPELLIDVHSELFKCNVGTKFRAVIVNSFRDDGLPDDDEFNPTMINKTLERYEYAMCGQVYRIEHSTSDNGQMSVYVSYGGLLMRLRGDEHSLQGFTQDKLVYLMVKKLSD